MPKHAPPAGFCQRVGTSDLGTMGTVNSAASSVTVDRDLSGAAGRVLADKALVLSRSKTIHNSGVIHGKDSLKINAAGFFNNATGSVLSKSVQITSTGALTNLDSIISEGDLRLSAASALANDGLVQAAKAWLNGQTIENRGKGDFRIASALSMSSKGDLINRGGLNALGAATLQAGKLINNGMGGHGPKRHKRVSCCREPGLPTRASQYCARRNRPAILPPP